MIIKFFRNIFTVSIIFSFLIQSGLAQSVIDSRHNLSVSGPGTITATSESEVCIFCHTPHNSSPRKPLWNKADPGVTYDLYSSSTLDAVPGQPDGSSILCLSCHDGTIALGNVLSRSTLIEMAGGISAMPTGTSNLSTYISDDHPISFLYNATLAATDGELADPSSLSEPVELEDERLQCTSCHDPHRDIYGDFLVASTQYSGLCMYCHQKNGWDGTAHNTSTASWSGSGNDPWFHTEYNTVAENACENCHDPHAAGGPERLTNYLPEENNCLDCHNSNVAGKDIQTDFGKTYRHDIFTYSQVHDPGEPAIVDQRHVECVDCHNPHFSNDASNSAPNANGFLAGVSGVNSDGTAVSEVQYEYEICYRCHTTSLDKPGSPTSRQIEQDNVGLEFDPSGPSFHPIESPGKNPDVPSLISPYTEASYSYCTDCHASDAGTSDASGPHGSIYPHILKYDYETTDYTPESYQAYELCYQCHDQTTIINSGTPFGQNVHRRHIILRDTHCNICHDPHGISSDQGTEMNNTHLINFDISSVSKSSGAFGKIEFIDDGDFSGQCYLRCHGWNHNPSTY